MADALHPFEFAIEGVPISLQAKNRTRLQLWIREVKEAAIARRDVVCPGCFLDERPVAATIYYFAPDPMLGDVDNIVKPILDALKGVAYLDDRQVERVVVQKFEPHVAATFVSPTVLLAEALDAGPPTVYVRIDDDLLWREV